MRIEEKNENVPLLQLRYWPLYINEYSHPDLSFSPGSNKVDSSLRECW